MPIPLIVAFGLAGCVLGSFLNVCIDRLPEGGSLVSPPSHCPHCQRRLGVFDLIPVLSYLWLRGRCRYCDAPIPRRVPLVEAVTGISFAVLSWHYGLEARLGLMLFYVSLMIVIFVVDLEHQLVLDKVVYPAAGLSLILSLLWPGLGLVRALVGGALGLVLILIPFLASRGGMGAGDVKLAGLVGLITGFPGVLIAIFLTIISGGVIAGFLILSRLKGRKDAIPFAPFFAVGTIGTLLWGTAIQQWYLTFSPLG